MRCASLFVCTQLGSVHPRPGRAEDLVERVPRRHEADVGGGKDEGREKARGSHEAHCAGGGRHWRPQQRCGRRVHRVESRTVQAQVEELVVGDHSSSAW
ncbi:unnamed protein product, partial [Ectocarpus sp. 12 AP-2014]